jgi:hypothetical protein
MSDGQTQTCESIQRQNEIDWTKPVEYTFKGVSIPVLHMFVLDGVRWGSSHRVIKWEVEVDE